VNKTGAERFSIPLFFGTDYDVPLKVRRRARPATRARADGEPQALPSCVSEEYPAKYEVVTAGEYVQARLAATYAHSK
jgi:hypothetical protein